MKIDLDELERKARAATQGEWAADRVSGMPPDDEPIMAIVISDELSDDGRAQQIADCYDNTRCSDEQNEANAAHIAAASPQVVLALIARIRELKTFGEQVVRDHVRNVDEGPMHALLEKGAVLP